MENGIKLNKRKISLLVALFGGFCFVFVGFIIFSTGVLKGVTLESLVVAVRVARAVKKHIVSGKLNAADFPLLLHTDEILTEKKPVNIPWESFTFER